MLDKLMRGVIALIVMLVLLQSAELLLVRVAADAMHVLGTGGSFIAQLLVLVFSVGLTVRAGRNVAARWRAGAVGGPARMSVRRRAREPEPEGAPRAPEPVDRDDPPLGPEAQ